MAIAVFNDPFVSINGVDLSDHVRSVTLNYGAEPQDMTASGDGTRINLAGLLAWSADIEFNQDYAAAEVDATLFSLVGAAAFTIILRPTQAAVSTTNPNFTGSAILESYQPMGGTIGEAHVSPVTLQSAGTLTRATS